MLFFAHLGITLGTALGINQLILLKQKSGSGKSPGAESEIHNGVGHARLNTVSGMRPSDTIACSVGALLSDIIDKPVGHYFFGDTFGYNGRIFSHTLLFALFILGLAFLIFKTKKRIWGFYLSFGVFMHLVLDYMWQTPATLFWPIFGWGFPKTIEYDWWGRIISALLHNPFDFIPEICGLLVTLGVFMVIFRRSYTRKPAQKMSKPKN